MATYLWFPQPPRPDTLANSPASLPLLPQPPRPVTLANSPASLPLLPHQPTTKCTHFSRPHCPSFLTNPSRKAITFILEGPIMVRQLATSPATLPFLHHETVIKRFHFGWPTRGLVTPPDTQPLLPHYTVIKGSHFRNPMMVRSLSLCQPRCPSLFTKPSLNAFLSEVPIMVR